MLIQKKQRTEKEKESADLKKLRTEDKTDNNAGNIPGVVWTPSNTPYSVKIGDINCSVCISDENGKININKLNDLTRPNFIKFLTTYHLDEMTAETITDSILDWIDPDDFHHANGAEKDYYVGLPEPYEPKNGPLDTIEELALVKGVIPQIYEMIRDRVTIYGEGKININFATKEVLCFIPLITSDIADAIIEFRGKKGVKVLEDLKDLLGHHGISGDDYQKTLNYLTISQSNYMVINTVASSEKTKSSYKIVVRKALDHCKIIAAYPE
ncbi:MAG TPA: general secretion pathway protein GspK [Candidatus Brocadiaceae bacterium]